MEPLEDALPEEETSSQPESQATADPEPYFKRRPSKRPTPKSRKFLASYERLHGWLVPPMQLYAELGVSRTTVYNWRQNIIGFAETMDALRLAAGGDPPQGMPGDIASFEVSQIERRMAQFQSLPKELALFLQIFRNTIGTDEGRINALDKAGLEVRDVEEAIKTRPEFRECYEDILARYEWKKRQALEFQALAGSVPAANLLARLDEPQEPKRPVGRPRNPENGNGNGVGNGIAPAGPPALSADKLAERRQTWAERFGSLSQEAS